MEQCWMLKLKTMPINDLYSLYLYIKEDYNRYFGSNTDAKNIVRERYDAVKRELDYRAYGQNPYEKIDGHMKELDKRLDQAIVINGDDPEKVSLEKFDGEVK